MLLPRKLEGLLITVKINFLNHLGDGCRSRKRLKIAVSCKHHLIAGVSRMMICGYETNYKLQVSSLGRMTKVSQSPLNRKKLKCCIKCSTQ